MSGALCESDDYWGRAGDSILSALERIWSRWWVPFRCGRCRQDRFCMSPL